MLDLENLTDQGIYTAEPQLGEMIYSIPTWGSVGLLPELKYQRHPGGVHIRKPINQDSFSKILGK